MFQDRSRGEAHDPFRGGGDDRCRGEVHEGRKSPATRVECRESLNQIRRPIFVIQLALNTADSIR